MALFHRKSLGNGINLFIRPTKKFKTILVQLIFHRHLREEDVTACSLLPSVLQRGSVNYPSRMLIAHRLEELYGAEALSEVLKKGERQLVVFTLDLVHDQFIPGENHLLRDTLKIFTDVLTRPLTEGEGFRHDFVSQEKEQHEKVIKGLINDKIAYSVERCLQEMCKDEPFGVYKYGSTERLRDITPASLYGFYRSFLEESPADLYIIGDVDVDEVTAIAGEAFNYKRGSQQILSMTDVKNSAAEVRYITEELDVNQGKLVMGFRTSLSYADDDYFPLLVYNGILGGFPHSKLFQNVREKAGLAYYAYSRLEKHKGLMVISSGIEVKNYRRTHDIILSQVEDMLSGKYDSAVFDNTKSGLRNQFLVEEDNPSSVINRAVDGTLSGREETTDELLLRLERVTPEDVVRVAGKVKLDTVYFLTKGGA